MLALGVLTETNTVGLFDSEAVDPICPGKDAYPLLSTEKRRNSPARDESIAAAILARARSDRDRAESLATTLPSSTTLASLAQMHAVLGEREQALAAAAKALRLSLVTVHSSDDGSRAADPTSARLAAEIMSRFGEAEKVFDVFAESPLPRSLQTTFASVAVELGRYGDAMLALNGLDGGVADSFRGFLLAVQGEYQKAIVHLRSALRESPDDADAAMNLSVCLWSLGSRRKAVATALRASRIAPGRKDLSLHYLELALESGDIDRLTNEIARLNARHVVADAHFLVVQARALLASDQPRRALPLLDRAVTKAVADGELSLRVEILANLAALRYRLDLKPYDETIASLSAMLRDYAGHESVVMSFARTASRTADAPALRRAVERIQDQTSDIRRAFLRHQVAWLEGDNEACASAATEWFDAEPNNPMAAAAAIVALGIGLERWGEAEKVAEFALSHFPEDLLVVNNAAYVLSMAGRAPEAIRLLEPLASVDFFPRATLGLAYLAHGDIGRGMRLYREAADQAEKTDPAWRSLMTTYQALIVRQLGIDEHERPEVISAVALAEYPLPDDWEERPDFVRLRNLCKKRGYGWPLCL